MTSYYDSGGGGFTYPRLTKAIRVLLLINVGVFLVNMVLGGVLGEWLGCSVAGLFEFWGLGSIRIVTSQFVHSYLSPGHILMNMLVLYFFGSMVQAEVGFRGLVKLYVVSGIVGAVVWLGMAAVLYDSDVRAVGASGACYGIMVYAAMMAPTSRVWFFGVFPVQLRLLVGILVFLGLYSVMLEFRDGVATGTAHGAHLGGALWGFLAFRFFRNSLMTADHRPWFGGLGAKLSQARADRRAKGEAQHQATLDQVLDKVHREGMSSLTAAERRFLERASRDAKRR